MTRKKKKNLWKRRNNMHYLNFPKTSVINVPFKRSLCWPFFFLWSETLLPYGCSISYEFKMVLKKVTIIIFWLTPRTLKYKTWKAHKKNNSTYATCLSASAVILNKSNKTIFNKHFRSEFRYMGNHNLA